MNASFFLRTLRGISDPAPTAAILTAAAVASLGGALASQFWGGLSPCVLCVWQRWPWLAVGLLSAAALRAGDGTRRALLALATVGLLIGAGIAAFHVGVEHGWWAGTAECGGDVVTPGDVDALRQALFAKPVPRCDRPAWMLAGISMAGWNVLFSLACAGLGGLAVARRRSAT